MTYQEMADQIADLIEQRLRIRGRDLEAKLKRAGRLLPKYIQRDGDVLVQSLKLQGSPKLARRVDADKVQRAFEACEKHLSDIDSGDRRKDALIGFLSTNAFNLLVITGLTIGFLVWQGLL